MDLDVLSFVWITHYISSTQKLQILVLQSMSLAWNVIDESKSRSIRPNWGSLTVEWSCNLLEQSNHFVNLKESVKHLIDPLGELAFAAIVSQLVELNRITVCVKSRARFDLVNWSCILLQHVVTACVLLTWYIFNLQKDIKHHFWTKIKVHMQAPYVRIWFNIQEIYYFSSRFYIVANTKQVLLWWKDDFYRSEAGKMI